jgi:zinc D-Ala-D-Ala carboxypeptidase
MKITPHFVLSELVFSQTAMRRSIPNNPNVTQLANLKTLCTNVLEPVRRLLGKPIFITSGFRSEALNGAIGGSKTSAHKEGFAADIICPDFGTPFEIAEVIAVSSIEYDQLIFEGGDNGGWVHIAYALSPRNEVLTAVFEDGGVVYRAGLV